MPNFAKNTFIYTLGNIIPQVANFILLPLYSKYLSPDQYGIVTSMQVVSAILAIFFTLSIERSIFRMYFDYKTKEEKKYFIGSISLFFYLVSLLNLIIMLVFLKKYISMIFTSIDFYPYYLFAILISYFTLFSNIPKIIFQVQQKASVFFLLSLLQLVLNTSFVIVFIVFLKQGAYGMLKGQLIAAAVITPLFLILNLKNVRFNLNYHIIKKCLLFSLPMIPAFLSAWVMNLSDRIFIERYINLYDLGIYSFGQRISSISVLLAGSFYMAYEPFFYKTANENVLEESKRKLSKFNNFFFLFLLFFSFLICLFIKELIVFLVNEKYFPSYKIVPLLIFGMFIGQSASLFNLSLYQEKKSNIVMICILITALVYIMLNFILVPRFGIYGAAYTAIISNFILFTLNYYFSKRAYFIPIKWNLLLPSLSGAIIIIVFFSVLNLNIYLSFIIKILLALIVSVVILFKKKLLIKDLIMVLFEK